MEKNKKTDDKVSAHKPQEDPSKHKKLQQQMSYSALMILAVVVVSFVAWPILSNGANTSENIHFGSYRGESIDYSAEYGLFNNNLNSLLNQLDIDSTSSDYQRRNVFERAFFSTVSQYGHYFFLRDRGNDVSRREANTLIYKQFTADGGVDRAAWNQLQNDPNRLKNAQNIMTYAASENIWRDVYESMDLINSEELKLLVPTLGDFRKVSYLYHRVSGFPEAEVEKFYNENAQLFEKQFLRRIVVDNRDELKKVEKELENYGNFGELAQLYSSDIYSQSKGEYGYKFYYEIRNSFSRVEGVTDEQAAKWADEIFALKQGEYAGSYELNKQWYFFHVKTAEEIEAEKQKEAEVEAQVGESAEEQATELAETTELEDTGFASVSTMVRSYIEDHEMSLITDYFRKDLEILKANVKSVNSLIDIEQGGREVKARFDKTPEFFGFSYSGEDGTPLYDSIASAFTEDGLAAAIGKSRQFFENIFSLKLGELSDVMLFGAEDGRIDQQYLAFFRLEEIRDSNVRDFARSKTDGLDSKKPLYNYYLNSLLTGGLELEFLNNRNLKQRFESAYSTWISDLPQN